MVCYVETTERSVQLHKEELIVFKKTLAILCALTLVLTLGVSAWATSETPADRPAPEVIEGEKYVSDHLPNASSLYVAGETVTLDNAYFYSAGYATDADVTAQIPNQYGIASAILAVGEGSEVVLNNPTIVTDSESYANGVFAVGMAKIRVNGGTIDTDNGNGHGIDATYMGKVYAYDTVIHTRGETSGALATDFGGGFIIGERLDCTTESGSAPGIFCAGSTVIHLTDTKFTTQTATGIVVAHDHAVVVLNNCEVNAAGTAVSGLQALPSAESSDGSTFYSFGSKLTSRSGAVLGESGGRTEINLIDTICTPGNDTAINVSGGSVGILTVNLWDTELVGKIACGAGSTLTVNVYAGGKLVGEVSGEGNITINVFDGGEYVGSFAANQMGEGVEKPVCGTFDDYLIKHWASGSSNWSSSRAADFAKNYEPSIIANSAASKVVEGAAAKPYDAATFNPSEGGVDLSELNVGGAYGFTVDMIFGDGASSGDSAGDPDASSGDSAGDSAGDSSGDSAGDSAGAPADGESSGDSAGAPAAP